MAWKEANAAAFDNTSRRHKPDIIKERSKRIPAFRPRRVLGVKRADATTWMMIGWTTASSLSTQYKAKNGGETDGVGSGARRLS
jgi:hypothetical protein